MKKILLSIVALLCVTLAGAQELAGYKATTSSFKPSVLATVVNKDIAAKDLPGMSILSNAKGEQSAKTEGKGFAIGFDFPFNGKTMKYFGIGANGLIKLSETEDVTMQSTNNPHFATEENGGDNTVFFYDSWAKSYAANNTEGKDTTTISYTSTPEALTVQFGNLGINTSSWSTNLQGTYTVEISLVKDGTIKYIVYGLQDLEATNAGSVFMGIRGNSGDYLTWNNGLTSTVSSWQNASSFKLSKVTNCYTVILNTPTEVEAPTVQPTDMQISTEYNNDYSGGVKVQAGVKFTNAEGVDKYLVLGSEGAPTELPVDGTEYEKGATLGNATVMLAGPQGSQAAWLTDMKHDTKYTFTVYAYNSYGKGGAKYNTVAPLTNELTTAPAAPKSFSLKESGKSSMSFTAEANEAGEKIYVVFNDSTYNPENRGSIAYTGAPDASKQAGDQLYVTDEQGNPVAAGKVAYFGPAADFTVDGLDAGKSYYFTAYSYNETTEMFSTGYDRNVASASGSTNIVAPYKADFSKGPESYTMGGWAVTPEQTDMSIGFNVPSVGDAYVTPQVEGTRHYECAHQQSDDVNTYTLTTPVIECTENNTLTFDMHMHKKGSGWFGTAGAYDEWNENDYLTYYVVVDGQKTELKKYTAADAPTLKDGEAEDPANVWHTESFDLSAYAGQNIQFGIEWHCENSSNTWYALENFAVAEPAPEAKTYSIQEKSSGMYVAFDESYTVDGETPAKNALYYSSTPYEFTATYDEEAGTYIFTHEVNGEVWSIGQSTKISPNNATQQMTWNFTNTGNTAWTADSEGADEGYIYLKGEYGYWKSDGTSSGAYLFCDASKTDSKTRQFKLIESTPTSVASLNRNTSSNATVAYNMQGIRVNNAKGLVIVDGQKLIRK